MQTSKGPISREERHRLEAEGLIPPCYIESLADSEDSIIYFGPMPNLEWTDADKAKWELQFQEKHK